MSAAFKRYAPTTTSKIPTNFIGVGTSFKAKIAIIVVKTGPKDAMGEIREIGDLLIATYEHKNATASKSPAIPMKTKKSNVVFGTPPKNRSNTKVIGMLNKKNT